MTSDEIWLTADAFDKLREEYDYLIGPGRDAVSAKIAHARAEGDLSENAGYHAARDEQGQQELRIRQLKEILENAQVGTAPTAVDGVVRPGMTVTIAFDGDLDDTDTFLLGSREVAGLDPSIDLAVYSPQSPLGAAIVGQKVGETVSYSAPNGRTISVQIVSADVL